MCVLELASVLAGDTFSAYPVSVCPVIATFLRCYNDEVDDRRRRDLIPLAAAVVGSRATKRVEWRRAQMCRRWVVHVMRPGFWRHPVWTLCSLRRRNRNEAAAIYAALVALDGAYPGQRHEAALDLVSRLVAHGSMVPSVLPPADVGGDTDGQPKKLEVSR
jgi:hypothetical protein